MKPRALVVAVALLAGFVLWTGLTWRPTFVTYHSKYSIFSRHYRQHGVLGSRLIPHYNFTLADPPSTPYVSHPPLVPLVMHAASLLAGDRPPTYYAVIIAVHVAAFVLLAGFVCRRWGETAALWTLALAVLSRYALTYGDQQTPELLGVVGGFTAVFLYFDWIETRRARALVLAVLAYLVGLAADYLTAFAGLTLCAHWLLFARRQNPRSWLGIALLPVVTLAFVGLMVVLMREASIPLGKVIGRAVQRSSGNAPGVVLQAYVTFPLRLLGPVMVVAGLSFVAHLAWRRRQRGRAPGDATLEILGCLAAPGLLAAGIFGQAFLTHQFLVLYLLPFFAVAGGLGLAQLSASAPSSALARWGAAGVIGAALLTALPGNARLATASWRPESAEAVRSRFGRLQRLAEGIKPAVRDGDRLLILNGQRYSEPDKVTVFHTLWIPCIDGGGAADWDGLLAARRHRLILAMDATALAWLRSRPDARLLTADEPFALFEAAGD